MFYDMVLIRSELWEPYEGDPVRLTTGEVISYEEYIRRNKNEKSSCDEDRKEVSKK